MTCFKKAGYSKKTEFCIRFFYTDFAILLIKNIRMKNFKTIFALVALLLSTNFVSAQAKIDWREKNRFHRSIGETFHPMEDGDFKPIRSRSV